MLLNSGESPLAADAGPYAGWARVAVMEPKYIGQNPARQYLVQGIVDEIVSALSANTSLEVISTLSTRVYSESGKPAGQIARELAADGLIESTLIDEGDKAKLYIRLADGKSGRYLWDHPILLSREDVFEIQNKVEGVLYAQFRPVWLRLREHLARAGTVEAYALFLEGRRLFQSYGVEENWQAIDKFEESLEKDPEFAPAWAALARAYGNVVNVAESSDPSWLDRADEAAQRAIDLAPRLPDGYYARGINGYVRVAYFGSTGSRRAEDDIDMALSLSPDFAEALLAKAFLLMSRSIEEDDMALGEDALRFYERGLTLQPNLPNAEANYAFTLARTGQLDAAVKRVEQALGVHPVSAQLHVTLADVLLLRGDARRAARVTEDALQRGILASALHQARLAAFYAAAGDKEKAREVLSRIGAPSTSYEDFHIASALAGTGAEQEALERLRAWRRGMEGREEQRGLFLWWLRNDPNFQDLREKGELAPFLDKKQARLSR